MNYFVWLRVKLLGPPDSEKPVVIEEIEHEVSRLNGAKEKLVTEVRTIKNDRELNRQAFSRMLDETLAALKNKEKPR